MNWQEAWERDKHAVGRAVHEAWAAEKVRQGFADHAFTRDASGQGLASMCDVCGAESSAKHHTDMLDYDDLAPHIQQYDIETGIVGYRMGYEAARRDAAQHPSIAISSMDRHAINKLIAYGKDEPR